MSNPVAPYSSSSAGFELSPAQARLWRWQSPSAPHTQGQAPSELATLAELELQLPEGVDEARLRASLESVCSRHEVLRTRYERLADLTLPVQVISPEPSIAWNTREPGGAPLWVSCSRAAAGERARLSLQLPALSLDAESLVRFAAEWAAAYHGSTQPEAPLQYADYAAWRRDVSDADESARAFWRRQLARRSVGAALPLRQRASARTRGPALQVIEVPLGPDLLASVARVASEQATEPALLVLAAWVALLHQHGESEQLTLGLDWQERSAHWGELLGLLSEPLPLVLEPLAASSSLALLAQLRAQLEELRELRDHFPSSDDEAAPPLGFRFAPLEAQGALAAAGFAVSGLRTAVAPQRLLLELLGSAGHARLRLHHDPELYSTHAAELIGDQLCALLAALCQEPERPLRELSALSAAERQLSLAALSRPEPLPPEAQRRFDEIVAAGHLGALLAQVSREHAQRPAVHASDRTLRHAELDQASDQLAQRLRARGAGPGSRLVHFLERDSDAIVALLAILKLGGVYVPIDPAYPAERIAFILRDAGVERVITRGNLCERLPEAWRAAERVLLLDEPDTATAAAAPAEVGSGWTPVAPSDLAYVIYTSGSTGEPRGVPITHENALYSLAARLSYYPEPIGGFLLLSSFAFDSSIAGLFGTLAQGGCLYVCSERAQKDPEQLARVLAEQPVTHLLALPSLYQLLLPLLARQRCTLRAAIVAGESCPRTLVEQHHQLLAEVALYNEYGATEASVWSTVARCASERPHRPVSIGRPIPGSVVYVCDEHGEPAARGLAGELVVGGQCLSPGYLNRPELTRHKFIERDGQRLYRTGDLAYWDGRGEIVFLGRADGQVKIRGHRIELGEVEAALLRVTAAEQVVVLLARGEDEQPYLRAFLGRCPALDRPQLRAALGQLLPEVMIPSDVQVLPELPLSANGKFDRRALLELRPQHERAQFSAPESAFERRLAGLWESLLGTSRIGRDDDFFALGGHSLLAIRLVYELRAELGVELPVVEVFQAPRLRDLAARLEALANSAPAESERVSCVRELLGGRGAGALGAVPVVFCVDPTGQHVTAYEPLARSLAPQLELVGLDLGPALLAAAPTIEHIARELAAQLLARQPAGPHRLLGWSLGGVFALAVARQLEQSGGRVEWVALLDTQPPRSAAQGELRDVLAELGEHLAPERRAELWALPATEQQRLRERLAPLNEDERIEAAVRFAQSHGWLADDAPPEAYRERYALLRAAAAFVQELAAAPLAAPLVSVWSQETLARHGGPPTDWRRCTRGTLTALHAPGDHRAVLEADATLSALRERALAPSSEVAR